MKNRNLLLSTILSTTIALGMTASYAADSITTGTIKTAASPITKAEMADPRVAATGFVEHVNFARVALAMKNADLAKQHITQARNMVTVIKSSAVEQRVVTNVESGRIVYKYDTEYKYHYFPIQTGPVEVKTMDNGPVWATNDLAVTDADIVYLTLDLTGDKAEAYLAKADAALTNNDLKLADDNLAQLTESVVTLDNKVAMPSVKAHDNIALARNFIAGKNYEGASYALKHADDALNEMQRDNNNKARLADIAAMRKDVSTLQDYIAKKDPNMIEKANAKMDEWWKDLNNWGKTAK
ncbi:MAG: YfdX family protein [Rickettsiales bacterium]